MKTKKILIWGEAGVGKTTFCSKFLQDWAIVVKENEGKGQELTEEQKSELEKLTEEQRSKLNNIGLLLFIVLRDIGQGAKTVKDIITSQLGFHKEGTYLSQCGLENQLLYILQNVSEHTKLVLLMDGFDEISDKDENIEDAITGRTYQNIRCITTCRPHATGGIVLEVDIEIRLKGFSEAHAKSFVEMYARIKYTDQNKIGSFVKETMNQIESSADLLEMSTNPSMLQLLCLLSWNKVKIGKNRTSVFKHYTCYLLNQNHIKLGNKERSYTEKTLYDLYHQNLLDAGKVALMGLKQNQLQLVFSKSEVFQVGGKAIFDIGFLTELPSTSTDSVKVQFKHKMLQEYLAAYYVVNSPADEGLRILMEFCSTSKSLMGSKIILEFVLNMSENLGTKIQEQVANFSSSLDSDDGVNPESRTAFLISMLEGNETLKFPLPAVIDLDLWKYDFGSGKYTKSALGRFFGMDAHFVRKINISLGLYTRLNMILNSKIDCVDELSIQNYYRWSETDDDDLCHAMNKMKPGLLRITNCQEKLIKKDTILLILQYVHSLVLEKFVLKREHFFLILRTGLHLTYFKVHESGLKIDGVVIEAVSKLSSDIKLDISGKEITLIHKSATMKSLSICNRGIQIDTEIAEAVSRIPDHTELDLSGNQVTDKSAAITLIHKSATMKSLNIHNCTSNCGIQIDKEIAEAVCRLPDHTQLDLSGNQVTDKSACITLIHKAATMKSLNIHDCMSNCGIQIDTEIAEAVSRLPDHTQLDLSGNQVTDKSACITLIHKTATMKSLNIHDCMSNCGIQIDTEIAEAVSRLPDHTQLDLSGNQVTDKSACITLIHKAATMKSLNIHDCMSNCGIQIDTEIAEAVSRLPDHTQLDLSGNQVTDKSACITLIHKTATMKSLNIHDCMSNCGIQIDTEIAEAVSRLPDHTQLDLSGNKVTGKSVCIKLIHKAATMKSLSMCNCGMQIDTDIAEVVSMVPDHTQLDLSGNKITDNSACITLIHKAVTMKSLSIHNCMNNCGIKIGKKIAEAVSRLPDYSQLDLSGNQVTDKSVCITLIHKATTIKSLSICYCDIRIDTEIAEAVSRVPDHTQLDLSGNHVTDKAACITLIHKAVTMKSLNIHNCISNCGINIGTKIAEAVSRLPDDMQLDLSGNQVTDKSACIKLLHKSATMKSLIIHNCMSKSGIQIDSEIAEAVSRLSDDMQLDLSGNQVTNKSACITLLHKSATMKSLNIHNCMSKSGIQIDTEIAEAVSRLPDHTQLDLSGNQVTDKSACITLIHKAATMKSLNIHDCMSNCGIQIDTEIAEAVSRLPDHTQLDMSGNCVRGEDTCITLIHKAAKMKSLNIHNCMSNCGIQIDTEIAEAVSCLPDHTEFDLSCNKFTDKSASIALIHKAATLKSLRMCNCGIQIDTEIAEAVSRLPDHTQLDLSGNKVTKKSACITLINKAATMKSLSICYCGIRIDTEIAEAVSRLPDHTQLDLSGNQVTDKSACITLIHKAVTMKSLSICFCGIEVDAKIEEAVSMIPDHTELDLSGNQVTDKYVCITLIHKAAVLKSLRMCNCGIEIDAEIAEAVSRLPDDKWLDLSGNQVTDKSACITLIHKAATMKSLFICFCGINIDAKIAEAVSRIPDHTQLDLSGNQVTDKSACITLINKATTIKSFNIHDCVSKCGIDTETEIAGAVSRLPDHTQLDLSGNQVRDKSACITLIHKVETMKSLSICYCGIEIDTKRAEAISRLPDHSHLDLSGHQFTDKYVCITLIHRAATLKSLRMCNCGIEIDAKIAEAVSRLPDHTQLDLSGNQVTDKSACITLIHKAANMKSLNIHNCMTNCGIQIDTEIAEAVSRLPDHTQLDLSGNQVTDKSACITLFHKAANMKSLNIHNCMTKCGIQIDTDIAEAVSRLPDHTQFDLSGNQVTDKSACSTLIHKAANMKSLNIHNCMTNCGIQIDTEIAEAVSRLPDHTQLDLSGNYITKMEPCLLSRILLYMTKQEKISIDGWGITVDEDIVRALSKLSKLQTLILNYDYSGNKLTPRASSELPHTVSSMPHLQVLFLDDCDISNDVMVALTDSLYKHCPLLKELSLDYNHLSSGVWEVLRHIQQMKNLRWLWLDWNPCVKDDKHRDKIKTTLHRSNPNLRLGPL